MEKRDEILKKKAADYLVCFCTNCPRREHCLHFLVGEKIEDEHLIVTSVNPNNSAVAAGRCRLYAADNVVRMAKGMTHFYHDMPGWQERIIKHELIGYYGRKYYYQYHNGSRLITPDVLQQIEAVCLSHCWTAPLHFDDYIEDFTW